MADKHDLTALSDVDLLHLLDETKDEALNLRFQHVTGQLENFKRMGVVRKQVARIKTELRMREIRAAESVAASASTTTAQAEAN